MNWIGSWVTCLTAASSLSPSMNRTQRGVSSDIYWSVVFRMRKWPVLFRAQRSTFTHGWTDEVSLCLASGQWLGWTRHVTCTWPWSNMVGQSSTETEVSMTPIPPSPGDHLPMTATADQTTSGPDRKRTTTVSLRAPSRHSPEVLWTFTAMSCRVGEPQDVRLSQPPTHSLPFDRGGTRGLSQCQGQGSWRARCITWVS